MSRRQSYLGLLNGAVDDLDGVEEGHGGAQTGADDLDGVSGLGCADAGEFLAACLIFFDELFGKEPSCISSRSLRMAFLTSGVTTRGPAT